MIQRFEEGRTPVPTVVGGEGVGKRDRKWQAGGASNLDFSSDVIYEWPLTFHTNFGTKVNMKSKIDR